MRTAIVFVVLCAFASLGSATTMKSQLRFNSASTAHAEVFTKDRFYETCSSLFKSGAYLLGFCKDLTGKDRDTRLYLNDCFANINGAFSCGKDIGFSSYDWTLRGSVLSLKLRTYTGSYVSRDVDLNQWISNINGELVCDCNRKW